MAVAIEFGSQGSAASTSSVATIASLDFNAEASDRLIAASIAAEDVGATVTISSVTIGGVSATKRVDAAQSGRQAEIWVAAVPTGTSGSVVATLSGGDMTVSAATYSVTGADATPTDTDEVVSASAASVSITALTIPSDGAGLACFCNTTAGSVVEWTGASESHDTSIGAYRHSSAIVTTVGTNTITADGGSSAQALVGVAWGPAASATTYSIDLDPASFTYTPSGLSVPVMRPLQLSPASFAYSPVSLNLTVSGETEFTGLGPGWGARNYRLEWRDRKWVKRKEREDELATLIRQVYAELSGEAPAEVIEDDDAAPAEKAAAKAVQTLAPFKDGSGIDWEALAANAAAIARVEDALEAYIKARDEEDDWLLMVAA